VLRGYWEFVEFHNIAYRRQPAETTALSVDDLKGFGKSAGITGDAFNKCVAAQAGAAQVSQLTQTGLSYLKQQLGDKAGTPSLFLNGHAVTSGQFDKGAIAKVILAAGNAPSSSASTTASPSATQTK
jgi:protein-disulfide isomerase